MKKLLLPFLFLLFSLKSFTQVIYEPGYIINEAGEKNEVWIRNDARANKSEEIKYKSSPNGEIRTATIQNVKEFGIGDSQKYSRATVGIDRSSDEAKSLSTTRNADLKEETQFLQVLIEGYASLYRYRDGSLERFFLKLDDGDIEQLIYKRFTSPDSKIRENNRYKQQLLNTFSCGENPMTKIGRLPYRTSSLMEFVQEFNECAGGEYQIFLMKKKAVWNLRAKAGVNLTNFSTHQDHYKIVPDFQYTIDPRVGVEVEYIFPFSNNKLSLFIEPGFTMHKARHDLIVPTAGSGPSNPEGVGGYPATVEIDYKAVVIPLGIRYYFFLNDTFSSKMFVNAGLSVDLHFNSSQIINNNTMDGRDLELNSSQIPTAFAGIGYSYNDRFNIEARYYPVRTTHETTAYKLHQDHSFALLLGYKLF
ncbi:MAG TPA: porin family protein [Gillisia sp.]|nr:porin family protein [Gillisia sp.]